MSEYIPTYFMCNFCSKSMFDLNEGEKCYVISKQTASKEVSKITEQEQTVFRRTAVGFRFCEKCWEKVAGKEYNINL